MLIKSGFNFTLLLTNRGEVYSWGINEKGQLGNGVINYNYNEPVKINFSLGIPIKYISAGYFHAAAIDYDHNVYIWGNNAIGELEFGGDKYINIPKIIDFFTDKGAEKIYCQYYNTFVKTKNGNVYSWGYNFNGILGLGHDKFVNIPTLIKFPYDAFIKKIYIGYSHAFAIDKNSEIYSWGNNSHYQLCDNNLVGRSVPTHTKIFEDSNVKKIICLNTCTIILADHKLYSIGYNNHGELGLGIKYTKKLTQINIETNDAVEKLAGNFCTVFCKITNGNLYAWGLNENGQLGIGNTINQNIPVKLNIQLDIKKIIYYHSTIHVLTINGDIYTWGKNLSPSDEEILEPTEITYFIEYDIDVKSTSHTKSAKKIFD